MVLGEPLSLDGLATRHWSQSTMMLDRMLTVLRRNWQSRYQPGSSKRSSHGLRFEQLELRALMAADANLVAYRPVTDYINYALHPVPEAFESDPKLGPGIRVNGDDDNANGRADYLDAVTASGGDNDLVRVDALGTGSTFNLAWTGPLAVWSTPTKIGRHQQRRDCGRRPVTVGRVRQLHAHRGNFSRDDAFGHRCIRGRDYHGDRQHCFS